MAIAIKTLQTIGQILPLKTKLGLLECLVMSHLNYSAILLTSLSEESLGTLERQLNWAVRAICKTRKNSPVTCLKVKHKILPIRYRIQKNLPKLFFQLQKQLFIGFLKILVLETVISMKTKE